MIFPIVLPSAFGKSSAPGICISFLDGRRNVLILLWSLHLIGISALGYSNQVNGVGWASPQQPAPQGGKEGSQHQTSVYRKVSLQWISLFQWNNRRVLCCIIRASSLFWYYLWILANNRWLRPLLFWEVGKWNHSMDLSSFNRLIHGVRSYASQKRAKYLLEEVITLCIHKSSSLTLHF